MAFGIWVVKMKPAPNNIDRRIQTREFLIGDYDAAAQLWQRVEGLDIAEGDDREGVAQFLARNPELSRVAIDGSAIIGVVMCGHDGRRGHIYHLAVDPAYRRYGLGKRLVKECLDGLRRAGVVRAIILVADNNFGGTEFWRRAGWEDVPGAAPMGIDV
jgi:ribosomal protein S18 acetylase RimI-like enzyme